MRASTYGLMTSLMTDNKPFKQYIHPLNVLRYIQRCHQAGREKAALCCVTGTDGGSVRAPGALLAIHETGYMAGYLSNGCVDSDLTLHAQSALDTGTVQQIRYGAGSPFKDIILPCGGGVDVLIIPRPDNDVITAAIDSLERREAASLHIDRAGNMTLLNDYKAAAWQGDNFHLPLTPPLRLHIAGQGAEVISLSDMARAAQWDVIIETADPLCLDYAARHNLRAFKLETPDAIHDDIKHDPFTAFALLFHDHDWEGALLKRAVSGEAFYIGAMGSRAAHSRRCDILKGMGVTAQDIDKIHAPIGLIPASRNAYTLAISIMAEIMDVFTRHLAHKRSMS